MTNRVRKAAAGLARDGVQTKDVYQDGKYTFVKIEAVIKDQTYTGFGFAACDPDTDFSEDRGEQIAEGRAINMIAEHYLNCQQTPVFQTVTLSMGQLIQSAAQALAGFLGSDGKVIVDVARGSGQIMTASLPPIVPDSKQETTFLQSTLANLVQHGYGVQPPLPGVSDAYVITAPGCSNQ